MESTGQQISPRDGARGAEGGEVWAGVRAILAELLNRPESSFTPEARLESQLGFDSLMMIELSVRIEERFDVVVPPSASPADISVKTAADVVRFVEGLVAERDRRGS